MKLFFKIILRLVAGLAILFGTGMVAAFVHLNTPSGAAHHPHGDMSFGFIFFFFSVLVFIPLGLSYLLLRLAAHLDDAQHAISSPIKFDRAQIGKLILKIFLRTLGTLAILVGVGMSFEPYLDPATKDNVGITLFFYATLVFIPFGGGYLLISRAERLDKTQVDPDSPAAFVFKLGVILTLYFFFSLAICLPTAGRVTILIWFVLAFTRIHRSWSSRKFRTPLGMLSWADVFDSILKGIGYLLMLIVYALLTGGASGGGGFKGGGGSSGGGGASGRW